MLILLDYRRDLKFGPKRILKQFADNCTLDGLETLCKKIDETGPTERKAGSGRPRQFGFQKTCFFNVTETVYTAVD